jgi:hypothetical protein
MEEEKYTDEAKYSMLLYNSMQNLKEVRDYYISKSYIDIEDQQLQISYCKRAIKLNEMIFDIKALFKEKKVFILD